MQESFRVVVRFLFLKVRVKPLNPIDQKKNEKDPITFANDHQTLSVMTHLPS